MKIGTTALEAYDRLTQAFKWLSKKKGCDCIIEFENAASRGAWMHCKKKRFLLPNDVLKFNYCPMCGVKLKKESKK